MSGQRHQIKTQIIELQLSAQQDALEFQKAVTQLYYSKVVPLIEELCDRLSDPQIIHRIDTLDINLGTIDINDFEQEYITKIEAAIEQQLTEIIRPSDDSKAMDEETEVVGREGSVKRREAGNASPTRQPISPRAENVTLSPQTAELERLSYFLQTGTLPWWSEKLSKQALAECCDRVITTSPNLIKPIFWRVFQNERQLKRLIYQFNDELLLKISNLFFPNLSGFIADCNSDILDILIKNDFLKVIPKNAIRLEQWRGIFFSLPFDKTVNQEKRPIIQKSLGYLASCFHLNYFDFLNQIVTTVESLKRDGKGCRSELPEIIAEIVASSSRENLVREAELPTPSQNPQNSIDSFNRTNDIYIDNAGSELPEIIAKRVALPSRENLVREAELPTPSQNSQNSIDSFNRTNDIYIDNAGLVLLHPFLSHFFHTVGLVQKRCFINPAAAERAALLIQYLVEKTTEPSEPSLPLNKVLCGIDLLEPIEASLDIAEQERSECEALLTAVIQNWSILKNTSIEGLRKAFLQRKGILRIRDGNWLLQVEPETYDVLLEQLPWSISIIKLPWMDNVLYVEWGE